MVTGSPLAVAAVRVQDSTAALSHAPTAGVDSVVVHSPLPGGVATVVRVALDVVPWWVQVAGVLLGVVVAIAVVVFAIRRRAAIVQWVATRRRGLQVGLAAAVFLLILGAGAFGTVAWDYTQHDNGFCTGCHVMNPAFQEFVGFKDKHDTLSCHDCHQQSVFASMRQMYLWVAERPEEIRPHAKVANAVCMKCHVVEGDTAVWQRIVTTAGHRVHLESDKGVLKDLQCVTCHGVEVHRFVPAPETCGQSGCHETDETTIVLGKMSGQTAAHCTACHRFKADVPLLATRDSATGTLTPSSPQCLSCHEMQKALGDFDVASEPHGGTCGTCHNPHEQKTPGAAIATCSSAGCHDNWRQEPFHVGREHRRGAEECLTCHQPHRSKVDASDCESCHASVRQRTAKRPPAPFDTLRALRTTTAPPGPPAEDPLRAKGDAPPEDVPSGGLLFASVGVGIGLGGGLVPTAPIAQDSFPHPRHRTLACLTCHTSRAGHGGLTFVPPRGCSICHHQAPASNTCASCHQAQELQRVGPMTARVTVPGRQPRARSVSFSHGPHSARRRCVECHVAPVTLAVAPAAAECRSCHEDHHTVERDCRTCHNVSDIKTNHPDPETIHQRCDACHTRSTVSLLTPTRPFCATCHETQRTRHYEPKECTVCHFLTEPGRYRSRLLTGPEGG